MFLLQKAIIEGNMTENQHNNTDMESQTHFNKVKVKFNEIK